MQLHVTHAENYPNKKDGTPILDKHGKQKYRSRIKTTEKGEEMLTGFVYKPIQQGDVIEADVVTEQYQGQNQLRFAIKTDYKKAGETTQNNSETLAELKSQTLILRAIHEEMENLNRRFMTEDAINELKKSNGDGDPGPADDFEDFDPIAADDLPNFEN